MASARGQRTPIRNFLNEKSNLRVHVQDGIDAVSKPHRKFIDKTNRNAFGDSLALDDALRHIHASQNRWDYLLGCGKSGTTVIGLEAHSAKTDEVSTVINKRKAAIDRLAGHVKEGAKVKRRFWVASGAVDFADTEKTRRRLDQNGIEFVGTRLMSKHLPT